MKTIKILFALAVLMLSGIFDLPVGAASEPHTGPVSGVDAGVWNFRSAAELNAVLDRIGDDPGAGYYLINEALRRDMMLPVGEHYSRLSGTRRPGRSAAASSVLFALLLW